MATASSMIFKALVLNGEKQIGASMSAAEAAFHLDGLNSMLESWGIERLMCYQVLQENFALTNSTASYTIGSGATFNTARPVKIVDPCFIRDASNLDSALELIDNTAYGRIVQKGTSGSYPSYLNYDSAYNASGYGTINLYPAPQANLTLYINSWKALQSFSTIAVSTALPPGYQRAIEYNLAVEISGGYKPVPAEVMRIAVQSKAAIKTLNTPDAMMRLDYGVAGTARSGESILTGG